MSKSPNSRLLGGILLLTGTAIGGGLLALPIATSEAGFMNALGLMFGCWFLMTASAFLILEVNLQLPTHANIVSMARTLLGPWGTAVAWTSYLLLLYSIIAAYMSGGSDVLRNLIEQNLQFQCPSSVYTLLFTVLFGIIVYRGIHYVDYVNRGLMIAKMGTYLILVIMILPVISLPQLLTGGETRFLAKGFTVIVSAFSYANIIPSLRSYFQDDIPALRKTIFIGSTIPLICYILWNASVMGIIPLQGDQGLIQLSHTQQPTSSLVNQLSHYLHSQPLTLLANGFASVCVLTTFLTCSLGLSDFLADGLRLSKLKNIRHKLIIYGLTFLPPLAVTLFYPGIFIKALNYAGIYCLILFVLLPVIMAWRSRYSTTISQETTVTRLVGGKLMLMGLGAISIFGILYGLYEIYKTEGVTESIVEERNG